MAVIDDWGPVDTLIRAATGREDDIARAVAEVGVAETAALVVEEILLRCAVPELSGPADVQLELVHDDESTGYVVGFAEGKVTAAPGRLEGDRPTVRYRTVDALRGLFGTDTAGTPSRNVQLHLPTMDSWSGGFDWAIQQIRSTSSIVDAVGQRPADLGRLSMEYGSDKWCGWHFYTPNYERYFAPLRDEPVRLLEIGIGGYTDPNLGGGSLRMWRRYFRRGLVLGMDIYAKPGVQGPRIRTVQGEQTDPGLMRRLGEQAGPFDIVIDDGSHISKDVIESFRLLFPHVRPGGYYVIEDLQTSYWPEFGGSTTDLNGTDTTVGFLKTLLDGLHHPEFDRVPDYAPSYTDLNVAGVYFHRNLVFVEKGLNTVEGLPMMRNQPQQNAPAGEEEGN